MTAGNKYKNELMDSVFDATKSYGMKLVHLDLWEPYRGKDEKAVDDGMVFNSDIRIAIIDLVKYNKIAPIDAVLEVKNLKKSEAAAFLKLFELGINGEFIREHRNQYELTHPNFISTLRYLVKSEKLSLQDALQEMNTLDAHERYALTLFYSKGLRGDLLRALRASDNSKQFAELFKTMVRATYGINPVTVDYLEALIKADIANGITWQASFEEAAFEARVLSNAYTFSHAKDRLHFLNRHVKDGVRANNVPVSYDEEKQKAYRVLRWVHRLSVMSALAQMKDLDNERIHLLRKHFKAGVNHDVLIDFRHSYAVTDALMKHFHWKPLAAINDLKTLSITQARYLQDFAAHGLTLAQARELNCGDYSVTKKDVVLSMIEWGCNFQETLQQVMTMTDKQAQEMLSHTVSAPRVVPIKI